jgi:outer membrane protein OmpA-like peptidoglycan-associated protein
MNMLRSIVQRVLQRAPANTVSAGRVPSIVQNVLASSGKPLDAATRACMEPRFGHNFSQVRIHDDTQAADSAKAINAQAYTVGRDLIFGAGQFSPHTSDGRKLLAHELTHVLQQGGMAFQAGNALRISAPDDALEHQAEAAAESSTGIPSPTNNVRTPAFTSSGVGISPLIQRRLLVTGDKKDIKDFIGLLEPASGLTLKHDPKTNEISITASVLKPQSAVLASRLATIISDPKQDAEVHLGRKQEGVQFGAFPASAENIVQEIRIDQILALEKGVPGAGVATLAHELVENYEAHALKDFNWTVAFDTAHKEAKMAEDLIAGELIGPGEGRNVFPAEVKSGKRKIIMEIDDRAQYFIVWEKGDKGKVVNPRKVARVVISKHTISGFSKKTSLPAGAAQTIKDVVDDMKKNPTASVFIEGFASAGKTSDENVKLGEEWSEKVRDEVISQTKDLLLANWRKFHIVGNAAKGRNEVKIKIERPDI